MRKGIQNTFKGLGGLMGLIVLVAFIGLYWINSSFIVLKMIMLRKQILKELTIE